MPLWWHHGSQKSGCDSRGAVVVESVALKVYYGDCPIDLQGVSHEDYAPGEESAALECKARHRVIDHKCFGQHITVLIHLAEVQRR